MRSELIDDCSPDPEAIKYPCLRKNYKGNTVVLFVEEEEGTIVWSENPLQIGYKGKFIPQSFNPFKGSIMLTED